MDADFGKGEIEHHLCALHEHSVAPERRPEREAPFGRAEVLFERAHLDNPDRRSHPARHDAEAHELAGRALAMGPLDEFLVPFDRRRRRRDEARYLLGGEHREQRRRIREFQLAQRNRLAGEQRQQHPPVGRNRGLELLIRDRPRREGGLQSRRRLLMNHGP